MNEKNKMRIGIFDSGLGGLVISQAIRKALPDYDYVYFGDTLNVPYGARSPEVIYHHTKNAVDYLMRVEHCQLVIIACNTSTAYCARKLQQTYLMEQYPNRRILGVIVPTLEDCVDHGFERIGMLATKATIESDVYRDELTKINPNIQFFQQATPLLVPLIENDGLKYIDPVLEDYLNPLIKNNIDSLILGCTHYVILKPYIKRHLPDSIKIVAQDESIPLKLADYLNRHPETENLIGRSGDIRYLATDITESYLNSARALTHNQDIHFEKPDQILLNCR